MTLTEFMALSGPRYAVMHKARYSADPVLETYAYSPGEFPIGGIYYVAMNIEIPQFPNLAAHIESKGEAIVYEFTTDNDKVCFLTQSQVLEVKRTLEDQEPSPVSVPSSEI